MSEQRHSELGIHSLENVDPHELVKRKQAMRRARLSGEVELVT